MRRGRRSSGRTFHCRRKSASASGAHGRGICFGAQPEMIVAITGTNGKTSVSVFLRQIWAGRATSAASMGTIGVVAPEGRDQARSHDARSRSRLHRAARADGNVTASIIWRWKPRATGSINIALTASALARSPSPISRATISIIIRPSRTTSRRSCASFAKLRAARAASRSSMPTPIRRMISSRGEGARIAADDGRPKGRNAEA